MIRSWRGEEADAILGSAVPRASTPLEKTSRGLAPSQKEMRARCPRYERGWPRPLVLAPTLTDSELRGQVLSPHTTETPVPPPDTATSHQVVDIRFLSDTRRSIHGTRLQQAS